MAQKYTADLAAETLTDVTGGGALTGTYLVNLCNRSGGDITVRLAITTGVSPVAADYLEWDTVIEPGGVLSRWPLPLGNGWRVYARASAAGVGVNVIGRSE